MSDYRLTPAAQRDPSEVWDVTLDRWNADQAEIHLNEIREAIE